MTGYQWVKFFGILLGAMCALYFAGISTGSAVEQHWILFFAGLLVGAGIGEDMNMGNSIFFVLLSLSSYYSGVYTNSIVGITDLPEVVAKGYILFLVSYVGIGRLLIYLHKREFRTVIPPQGGIVR